MDRFPLARFLCVALGLLVGCASNLGSRSLPTVRMDYTESVARSTEQQLLLNIVRLRHARAPVFLQVTSITTQFGLATTVGVSANGNVVSPGGPVPQAGAGVSTGVLVEERPTITYTPLHGQDFVRRLATPLSPEAIAQLVQAGWPWDAVLNCCVQQINGLFAPSRPRRSAQTNYKQLGSALRRLQESHALSVRTTDAGVHELVFAVPGTEEGRQDAALVRELLGIDPATHRCRFARDAEAQALTVHGRSLLAALYYLSQGVDTPARGRPSLGPEALLHVRASKRAPKRAYAIAEYEGWTFYIDADDTESQGTFVLLAYLFSLMAAPGGTGPVITVGAGGG